MNINETVDLMKLNKPNGHRLSRDEVAPWVDSEFRDLMVSKKFFRVKVRTNKLAFPIKASRLQEGPIVGDLNEFELGKLKNGFVPKVIVLSGQKAFIQASVEREPRVEVWLGEKAIAALGLEIDTPNDLRKESNAPPKQTRLDASIALNAGRIEIQAHCQSVYKAGQAYDVAALHQEFIKAMKRGYKPKMTASAPSGWHDTVERMKAHPEIDNPFGLAQWMEDQGYSPDDYLIRDGMK